MEYGEMNVQQRAEHLLAKGVEAKLDIDPEALEPGYAAHVIGIGKLPCGYHASEQEAIDAGTAWLRSKAMPPNAELRDRPLAASPSRKDGSTMPVKEYRHHSGVKGDRDGKLLCISTKQLLQSQR